ncbi:MAG: hypothetical protein ACT4P3_01080 [Betaproteobacteria bacterium]
MRAFYVRPKRDGGYGAGDGTSYENAWNGVDAVDWSVIRTGDATLWMCGDPQGPGGFMTVFVEWSYLESAEPAARPLLRRESPQPA